MKMQTHSHANFNHVSPSIFARLAVMAEADGIDLEEYHEQILARWIQSPSKFCEISLNNTKNEPVITPQQAQIPNLEQAIADSPSFVRDILAMPKIAGHDDLFERSQESRELDFDNLYFGEKTDVSH